MEQECLKKDNAPQKVFKRSKETREKMSKSASLRVYLPMSAEHRLKHSQSMKKYYASGGIGGMTGKPGPRRGVVLSKEIRDKIRVSRTGQTCTAEQRKHYSDARRRNWGNLEYARKILSVDSPNKQEKKLQSMLDSTFPEQWSFVGDGQLRVGRKYPDFKSTSSNKLIELYGDFYHKGQNPDDRIQYFKQFGYDCIVIWASELKDEDTVISRVAEFEKRK